MPTSPDGRRLPPDLLLAVDRSLVRPASPPLLARIWHWRYELLLAAGAVLLPVHLVWLLGPLWAAVAAALLASVLAVDSVRAFLVDRVWCVVTAHRVRVGLVEAMVCSRTGKIPVIVSTHAVPYGEEVRLWCRAGTSVADLERARPMLAAACWAGDVWVVADPQRSHLVTLGVVRRRPRQGGYYPFGWCVDPEPPPEVR